eukprot:gene2399-4653_t
MQNPTNNLVQPLLTDMYQISMTYAYWKGGRADDHSVFDLFFRKCPFEGEYCVFAGLDEVLRYVISFKITASDIDYLRSILPMCEPAFFDWLSTLDCSRTKIYTMREGTAVFPREPLIRVEGPLAVGQLLETTLLNLVNFPSLLTTNAARMRRAAGANKVLLEFGLRRAQGPDGAVSASRYSIIGGFDGTSNVLAGKLFGISVRGTHAHAYVMAHRSISDLKSTTIKVASGDEVEFIPLVLEMREKVQNILGLSTPTRESELAAFISYAQSFPSGFLALVDTYDTLSSGVPNFMAVGLALKSLGYKPIGIRLDSGDLGELSKGTRALFKSVDAFIGDEIFTKCVISASDDINEKRLLDLNKQGHEIDSYGIGTNLVTCQKQPALGCVYKLVEINKEPRIKLSEDIGKTVMPCAKTVYRLYDADDMPIGDIMQCVDEPALVANTPIPVKLVQKATVTDFTVTASRIEELVVLSWDAGNGLVGTLPVAADGTARCKDHLLKMAAHTDPISPVPYKVYISITLFDQMVALQNEYRGH